MKKKIMILCLLILSVLVGIYWDLIRYGIDQAKGQLKIIGNAKPIEEVLNDPLISDTVKQKIGSIGEIRKFAMDSVGLTNSGNYTTFYDQKGKDMLWSLSACKPFEFIPKIWSFPLLGRFPYKGYFDLDKAKKELNTLKKEGYEARIRSVGGWSTLGWFSDPILSDMLNGSEGDIANLIIHELTHATIFVKNNIKFNENLASFIGQKGAVLYLKSKYGKGSIELEDYLMRMEDNNLFVKHMIEAAGVLDHLYRSFPDETPDSVKQIDKDFMIDRIIASIDTLHFHNNGYYKVFKEKKPNNAYFMSFLRYHAGEDSLARMLHTEYKSDLKKFVEKMTEIYE